MAFWRRKKKVDFSYSASDTTEAGSGDIDKSGRVITKKIHTDGFSIRRKLKIPIIDVYILKELFPAFIVAELFFTFVYLIKGIQEAVEQIVNKGLPAGEVLTVVGYMVGKAVPITTPMAVLMACIVTAGRFSSESEFVAMRGAGLSYRRIYRPFAAFSVVIGVFTFYFANVISPDSYVKFDAFQRFVENYNPVAIISPGEFVSNAQHPHDKSVKTSRVIYVEEHNKETGKLTHVQIRNINRHNKIRYMEKLIIAPRGEEILKLGSDQKQHKAIRLFDGYIVEYNPKTKESEITNFRKGYMDLFVDRYQKEDYTLRRNMPSHFDFGGLLTRRETKRANQGDKLKPEIKKREKLLKRRRAFYKEYKAKFDEMEAANPAWSRKKITRRMSKEYKKYKGYNAKKGRRRIRRVKREIKDLKHQLKDPVWDYTLEINTRFVYGIYCLMFGLVGFALGLVMNRAGRGMGFVAAILLIVLYVTGFNTATRMASQLVVDPGLAAWLPVAVLLIVTAYFTYTRTSNRGLIESLTAYFYRVYLKYKSRETPGEMPS